MSDAISTQGLTKYYGRRCVVNTLNLNVPVGSVYGLLGRNGSGKSTTIKMLMGLVQPDRGGATMLGESIATLKPETRAKRVMETATAAARNIRANQWRH